MPVKRRYLRGPTIRVSRRRLGLVPARGLRMSARGRFRRLRSGTNVMTIKRWLQPVGQVLPSGSSTYYAANTFQLSDLPDVAQFSALFDQYRILHVNFFVRISIDPAAAQTLNATAPSNTNNFYPDVYATVDHDDATVPTSIQTIMQYDKCKVGILRPNYWFKYSFNPTTLQQLYLTSVTTGYAMNKNKTWLDIAQTGIPYYGLKWAIDGYEATAQNMAQNLRFEYRTQYVVQFKNQR